MQQKNSNYMLVRSATDNDIEQILEINAKNLLANNKDKMTSEEFSKKGFILMKVTKKDLENAIADKLGYIVLVSEENSEITGYLTACDITNVDVKFQKEVAAIKEASGHKILYYKQIAKKPETQNVGKNLIAKMFDEARHRSYSCIICKIVHKPFYNQASIGFHEKYGFSKVDEIKEEDRLIGVYLKQI